MVGISFSFCSIAVSIFAADFMTYSPRPDPPTQDAIDPFDRTAANRTENPFFADSSRDRPASQASDRPASLSPLPRPMSYPALLEWAKNNEREADLQRQHTQQYVADLKDEGEKRLAAERRKLWLEWGLLVFVLLAMFGSSLLQFLPIAGFGDWGGTPTTPKNSAEPSTSNALPETRPIDEDASSPDDTPADASILSPADSRDTQTEIDRALGRWRWDWTEKPDAPASETPSQTEIDRALGRWQWDWTEKPDAPASDGLSSERIPAIGFPSAAVWGDRGGDTEETGDRGLDEFQTDSSSPLPTLELNNYAVRSEFGVDIWLPEGSPLYAVGKNGEKVMVRCESLSNDGFSATIVSESLPEYTFRASNLDSCLAGTHHPGEAIATVGDSLNSGDPHFHWEVQRNGTPIDPPLWSIEYVIKGDLSVDLPNKSFD
ncbi:hypothetical protein CKA32_003973 [Geitlerinema sp. FC II]|nr:hypothetical protein CKA32_003973 [Geitlerinema sp. FC II]